MLGLEPRWPGGYRQLEKTRFTHLVRRDVRFGQDASEPTGIPKREDASEKSASSESGGVLDAVRGFIDRMGAHNDIQPEDPYPPIPDAWEVSNFMTHTFYNSKGQAFSGTDLLTYFVNPATLRAIDGKRADADYEERRMKELVKGFIKNPRSNYEDLMTTKYVQVLDQHFNFSPQGHRLGKMYRLMLDCNILTADLDPQVGWVLKMTDHGRETAKIAAMPKHLRDKYLRTHYVEALAELLTHGKSDKVPAHIAKKSVAEQRSYLENHVSNGQWRETPNYMASNTDIEPTPKGRKTYNKEDVPMSRVLTVCGGMLLGIAGLGGLAHWLNPPARPNENKPVPAVTAPVSGGRQTPSVLSPKPSQPIVSSKPSSVAPVVPSSTQVSSALPPGNSFGDTAAVLKAFDQKELQPRVSEIDHQNGFFSYQFQTLQTGSGRGVTGGRILVLGSLDASQRSQFRADLATRNIPVSVVDPADNAPINPLWFLGGAMVAFFAMQLLMQHLQSKAQSDAVKNMTQPNQQMMNLGKHTGYQVDMDIKERFSDVGGNYLAKEELQDYLDKLKSRLAGDESVDLPKGMAMEGPPGTGKTLLARALAGEAGIPFFALNGADFVQMLVGVGASRVKDLFRVAREEAEKHGGAIIFIDEIDAIGKARSGGGVGSDSEREATLNALLGEMDGFKQSENVFVLCATNRYDILDPALKRPGRFTFNLHIPNPRNDQERSEILGIHIDRLAAKANMQVNKEAVLPVLSALCRNNSGADMMQVVTNGFDIAKKAGRQEVTFEDFVEGFQGHLFGKRPRKVVPVSERERQVVGHHEHGHGITGMAVGLPPLIVSMFERFKSGSASQGRVYIDPRVQDERMRSFGDYIGKLMMLTGGRAAEYQAFGAEGTGDGWSGDLENIRMILRYMMSMGMFGNQFARDIRDKATALLPQEVDFMNLKIAQALAAAIDVIEKIGPEKMQQITDLSLAMPNELVGEAAPKFYEMHLGPELLASIQEVGKTYIQEMAQEAVFQKPPKSVSPDIARLAIPPG